jgi:hypothetical protein
MFTDLAMRRINQRAIGGESPGRRLDDRPSSRPFPNP